jgi:putative SbcD/Mre11-related phosphoesterase
MAGVEYAERAAYLPAPDALVLADLHVGRDAASGVELPLGERADLRDRLRDLLDRFRPATVVFAGDVLHSFDSVPGGVPGTVSVLEGVVADAGADLVVTPGNHDGLLDSVSDARTTPELDLGDGTVVCHGHERPDTPADRYVVGHEHPAIVVEGRKHPCFLASESGPDGASILVLPAFSRLARGTVVNGMRTRDCMSPAITDLGSCRPIVVSDDEALEFPPLRDLREHL